MSAPSWADLEAIFHEALVRPPADRAAFLAERCAGRPDLQAEVDALLRAHEGAASSLEAPPVAPQPRLKAGARLGPYEVLAELGAGGMGEVYRARDAKLGRDVAIKILPLVFTSDPERLARFEREARMLAALNHPHIGAIYGIEEADGVRALVLELVEGETLADRLKKGALPLDQALQYAIQTADALAAAQRAGITHRDLKPGNIMLTKAGTKVLDFGLAKHAGKAGAAGWAEVGPRSLPTMSAALTVQGTILGTLQYMAPEQLEGKDADARTDIFAFGAVVYEMLTGKMAFEGKSQATLIAAIISSDPLPISAVQPLTPPALDRVVKKCLAKEPERRWQSASDLTDELKWIAEAASKSDAVLAPQQRRRSAGWLVAAVAMMMAITVAAVSWTALRRASMELPLLRFDVTTPPTSDPTSFAVSPDGRQLVFVANADGRPKLWLRPLDQTIGQPLAGTDGAIYPFWSPDNRAVAFFADGKLKRLDLGGGAPRVLANAPAGRGGTWNRDGVILFTPDGQFGPASILMRVAATGGTPTPVTRLAAGQATHRWPQFLPDGKRFLFFSGFGRGDTQGVYLGSLDGSEPTRLLAADTAALFTPPNFLLIVRQGALVAMAFDPERGTLSGEPALVAEPVGTDGGVSRGAFSVSSAGVIVHRAVSSSPRRQLVWINRAGKVLGTIGTPDENTLADPELAPDGRLAAVQRIVQGNMHVWLMDTERGVQTRFTLETDADTYPVWSPDGRRIAFTSNRSGAAPSSASPRVGAFELFEKAASGAGEEHSLRVSADTPLSWSSNGRFLLYSNTDANTGVDLWALPMTGDRPLESSGLRAPALRPGSPEPSAEAAGRPEQVEGRKPFPVAQTRFDERNGQFSPDGRWVAYESNESGRFEIYVRPFRGSGGKRQVSTAGGSQVRWRHDGKELFYVAPDERLMAVPITLAADGQTLNVGEPVPQFMTHLPRGPGIVATRSQYAVASDGRFLMNVSVDEAAPAPPITVVLNWTAGLKK